MDKPDIIPDEARINMATIGPKRRYDFVDLIIVGIYNAIVFFSGLGLGWILWGM